ncbi:maleylpyruvate isomerase N-terminal domain-containing protein [Thermocrispum sp.]|uniref:Maleylpyruvate isomerase N-terminal domain-containing protein n=1 Tax=Thermocrispum agreste TaxID=37925 RepID=A0ABD6FFY6_9PSEU|nr:maleylpyruvate isomerase N-terminal domain-containing protein [Thermocrispum sp.]
MSKKVLVEHGRLLDVLGVEVELLVDASSGARPDARVPAVPGLTLAETVRHVGSVYRMVVAWLRTGERPTEWQREPARGEPVQQYLRESYAELAEELARRDPHEPAGTWWPEDTTAGFWRRRMAHETTVHRTDVESAAEKDVTEVAEDVAVDGIDEVLTLWYGHRLGVLGVSGTRAGTVGISVGDRHWMTRAGPSATAAWRADADEVAGADARVTGTAMRLYLWLWGRVPTGAVTTEGDEDAVAQLWALLRLATR